MKKHRDVGRVSRNAPRAKGKELDPGFRRDDDVRAFAGMTKTRAFAGTTKQPLEAEGQKGPRPADKEIYRFIANKRYNPLPARQGALRPRVILRTFRKGLH